MPKSEKRNGLNIQLLNDFIYTVLYNASSEDKKGLQGKYLNACENIKDAKKFIESATREEKEYLLSQFGYQFFYVIAPYRLSNTQLKDFLTKEGFKITDLKKEGYYIHSDKEIMHHIGLKAKYVHSGGYDLNLELLRQSYHIKNWTKRTPIKDEAKDVAEADTVLMRTLLSATITMNYQQGITHLSDMQIQVLIFLYVNRNKQRSYSDIYNLFSGYKGRYTPSGFKSAINSLVLNQFVQKGAVDKMLTITSLGIKKCQEYRDAVIVNNSHF